VIHLYRRSHDPAGRDAETALRDMVLAHTVTVVDGRGHPELPDGAELPSLRDGETLVSGEDSVAAHLEELRALVTEWNRFQSDACFVEDDGSVC
jgi:hypothetical protein